MFLDEEEVVSLGFVLLGVSLSVRASLAKVFSRSARISALRARMGLGTPASLATWMP